MYSVGTYTLTVGSWILLFWRILNYMDKPVKKNAEPLTKDGFFKVLKKVSKKTSMTPKKKQSS